MAENCLLGVGLVMEKVHAQLEHIKDGAKVYKRYLTATKDSAMQKMQSGLVLSPESHSV